MNITFLSPTCIGSKIMNAFIHKKYNNPLIGSLFVNDYDFIKYCSNYKYYMNVEPHFGESISDNLYSKGTIGRTWDYPIMILDDIEIHWIHEKKQDNSSIDKLLEKYNRRNKRFQEFLKKTNKKIVAILSYSQLFTEYNNTEMVIEDYFKSSDDIKLIFVGPSKYNKTYTENNFYIPIKEWDNFDGSRDENGLYKINNCITHNLVTSHAIQVVKSQIL